MIHFIESGDWLFFNVPPMTGYGFKQSSPIWLTPHRTNGGETLFVPLLRVDGVPVDYLHRFLVTVGVEKRRYACKTREQAEWVAGRESESQISPAVVYPPLLDSNIPFQIEERNGELWAVPAREKDDDCLLFFGGDGWYDVCRETTTGTVLCTRHTHNNFFGIATMKPGQVVATSRGGYTQHTFVTYRWDGRSLKTDYASSWEQHQEQLGLVNTK